MLISIVIPPAPLVTAAEARLLAPGLVADSDAQIDYLIGRACAEIEPPGSDLGRAFGAQTIDVTLDDLPWGGIRLPYQPVRSVLSVTCRSGGTAVAVPEDAYYLSAGWLLPADGWPAVDRVPGAVTIRIAAGYDPGDPALGPARQAVALRAQEMQIIARSDAVVSRKRIEGVGEWEYAVGSYFGQPLREAIEDLISRYRVSQL